MINNDTISGEHLIESKKIAFLYSNINLFILHMSRDATKLVFGVSDHVRHKQACAATEDGYKLEILDLKRRGIILSV